LLDAARNVAEDPGAIAHVLFPTEPELPVLSGPAVDAQELSVYWGNLGYGDFDEFLGKFSSEKRKKAKRERRRVQEAGIVFEHLQGDEPTAADWDAILDFYSRTFLRRGREPYLNREFFAAIAKTMPRNLLVILARHHGTPIATAICFRSSTTLYGRYWGSLADFHSLHFETCYHQGIEYCIRERLLRFEPALRASTKSLAASRRGPRGRAIGSRTPLSAPPSARFSRARHATSMPTSTKSASTFRIAAFRSMARAPKNALQARPGIAALAFA
jgi:predicted N-acyltransferase